MSIANWKRIQEWAGASADGVPGPATAVAVLAKIGKFPVQEGALVKGTGRSIKKIFIHCTATREGQDVDAATIKRWHLGQGWSDIGYHYVIRLNGSVERGRPESVAGSHVRGFNTGSIGVVYVGGLDAQGKSKDTRTDAQKQAMQDLVRELTTVYAGAEVLGHRDASPDTDGDGVVERHEWLKECPCFDVKAWWQSVV